MLDPHMIYAASSSAAGAKIPFLSDGPSLMTLADVDGFIKDAVLGPMVSKLNIKLRFYGEYHSGSCTALPIIDADPPSDHVLSFTAFRAVVADGKCCEKCSGRYCVDTGVSGFNLTLKSVITAFNRAVELLDGNEYVFKADTLLEFDAMFSKIWALQPSVGVINHNDFLREAFGRAAEAKEALTRLEEQVEASYLSPQLRAEALKMSVEMITTLPHCQVEETQNAFLLNGGAAILAANAKALQDHWAQVPNYVLVDLEDTHSSVEDIDDHPLSTFIEKAWRGASSISCLPAAIYEAYLKMSDSVPVDPVVIDAEPPAAVLEIMDSFYNSWEGDVEALYAMAMNV